MGALGIFALIVLTTLVATTLAVIVWMAMLPGKIAAQRQHPQADAIRIAGWLGIITGVVWILALIWAYTSFGAGELADDGFRQRLAELEQRMAVLEGGEVITEGGAS
jgi:hypothetical protein